MAGTKYGKYVMKAPLRKAANDEVIEPIVHLIGERDGGGANLTVSRSWITQPLTMIKEPHKHDYDQFLFFMGGNPLDVSDFGAEAEITLGEEGEKHIVNTTSIVYMPKGLVHGPLSVTKVNKPFQWMHVLFAPRYDMTVGDVSQHPPHPREKYSPEEIRKLKTAGSDLRF